jgi:hypothetical protein
MGINDNATSDGACTCKVCLQESVVSWGGVRLSPLGTSATVWPIVAPDDR